MFHLNVKSLPEARREMPGRTSKKQMRLQAASKRSITTQNLGSLSQSVSDDFIPLERKEDDVIEHAREDIINQGIFNESEMVEGPASGGLQHILTILKAELSQSKNAHQELNKREEYLTKFLSVQLDRADRALQREHSMYHKTVSVLQSLLEITTLEKEFQTIADEKRKHQLAMEMEIVTIVEQFTKSHKFSKTELDAASDVEIKFLESLKICTDLEASMAIEPLPSPLPRDVKDLQMRV